MCSVCNRIVCPDCKVMDKGKIYCLEHAPKVVSTTSQIQFPQQIPQETKEKPSFKSLKNLIAADFILLVGIAIIYIISNMIISGLLASNIDIISQNFPQFEFVFVLLTYFESGGLYAILILLALLIIMIIVLVIKKRRYKNI